MKKIRFLLPKIILGITLLCSLGLAYPQMEPTLVANPITHSIRSNSNGKTYQVNVSLPNNYATADSLTYPVLYVLDGKYSFGTFHSIRSIMNLGSEIKDIIIVAVENECGTRAEWLVHRHYDLTPSSNPELDAQIGPVLGIPEGQLRSGGAALFLRTLEDDIIPFIKANYRTSKDQGISGHSLGGLFATYTLLTKPSLFNRYGINSPSFWWNNNEMLGIFNTGENNYLDVKAEIFFSVGELEGDMMVAPYKTFLETLEDKKLIGLQISSQIFEGETHLSVVPASSSRTLRTLYGL